MSAYFLSRQLYRAFLVLCMLMGSTTPAYANLSFILQTGDSTSLTQSLAVDSNKCTTNGPRSAFVGGVVTNNSSNEVTDAVATINNLNTDVYLAGGQPANQSLGTLSPGRSVAVYWFVGYSCTKGATATPTITLNSSSGIVASTLNLTLRSAISSGTGGQVSSSTLGAGAVVGQTITLDVNYDFGGTDLGDEVFLQPSGSQSFDAACFRLVGSEIIGSNLAAATVGTRDKLYFVQPRKQAGNNYFISVRYSIEYLCAGQSTSARPYAVQTSGNTNIKYTGNFDGSGSVAITFPVPSNPFQITKTVSESLAFSGAMGNLVYTVTISNPSSFDAILSEIVDTLPAGMSYIDLTDKSDITADNSSYLPVQGSTGTIRFIGRRGASYLVPAGGSVSLRYEVTRPAAAGDYLNSASGFFGSASTPVVSANYSQVDPQPLTVTKISSVIGDASSGTDGPFAIPGALIEYTIAVGNPNPLSVDTDSVTVTDEIPPELKLCLVDFGGGSGPVLFGGGSPSSNLAYGFVSLDSNSDDLEFSSDGGSSWTYTPSPDADGCDGSVSDFRVSPSGSFEASTTFTLKVRFIVK